MFQYKCRQNFFQVSKFTKRHPNIKKIHHQFAKQHNFKDKHDTVGNFCKGFAVPKMEEARDTFAFCGLSVYYLTQDYNAQFPPKWLKKLENNDPELEFKSPYETTRRFVAYLEDDKKTYDELVENNEADKHFIYSDREKVKKEEDTSPINDTKKYFSFWSNLSDNDIKSSDYGRAIPPAEDGTLTCRYCQSEMKQKTAFEKHEIVCKKKN